MENTIKEKLSNLSEEQIDKLADVMDIGFLNDDLDKGPVFRRR